jgi:hypothetical protein
MQSLFSACSITMAPSRRATERNFPVAKFQRVVGHVDLERGIALGNQRRQFITQNVRGGIGDDQMERVIDHRLVAGPAMVIIHCRAQCLALLLAGKRDHRSSTPAGSGQGAAEKIVGHYRTVAGGLIEMHMAVDAAGGDMTPGRIDLREPRRQVQAQRRDAAVADADVAGEGICGSDHTSVADDRVEGLHIRPRWWVGDIVSRVGYQAWGGGGG